MSTLRLLHNLHTMSLAKAPPDSPKDCECKKNDLPKCPPILYFPKKDCVQETVSDFKDNHLKMQIGKGADLQVPVCHSNMRKAFLIHVGSAQEAIKRKGYFKAYIESNEVYMEQCGKIKQLKAQLAELETPPMERLEIPKKPTRSPM